MTFFIFNKNKLYIHRLYNYEFFISLFHEKIVFSLIFKTYAKMSLIKCKIKIYIAFNKMSLMEYNAFQMDKYFNRKPHDRIWKSMLKFEMHYITFEKMQYTNIYCI